MNDTLQPKLTKIQIFHNLDRILKHSKLKIEWKFDFENCNWNELSSLYYEIVARIEKPECECVYDYPGVEFKELVAIFLYKLGVRPGVTTSIDEVSMNYGYGKLSDYGSWEFDIPWKFLKSGTILEWYSVYGCHLENKEKHIEHRNQHCFKDHPDFYGIMEYCGYFTVDKK